MERAELVKQLVERFRYRPHFLTVEKTVQIVRRLIAHAEPGPKGCALWTGAVTRDCYGRMNIRLHGEHCSFLVHRLADQLGNDPADIPFYKEVDHEVCDTPPCFHPDHIKRKRRLANRQRSAENTNRKRALRAEEARL